MTASSRAKLQARVAVAAGIVFLFFGVAKLATLPMSEAQFVAWHWPAWLVLVVAPSEAIAGVLLLARRTRVAGAAIGAIDMAGALFTHARTPGVGIQLLPLAVALLVGCALVLRSGWRSAAVVPAHPARGTREPGR
jgi:uncharacterized membrane protein YphA (DoxX/SURF4 family)